MITLRDLSVRYPGASGDVLRRVSLDAAPHRVTAVVGPNGSGKSTIVRALLGRVPVTGGSAAVDGQPLASWSTVERARRLAVVVQREEPAFPMRVRDYVALGRHPYRPGWTPLGTEDEQAIQAAVRDAGVDALVDRSTDALSGGEWQRVRLARALAQQAQCLVLDEPTTFLDIAHEMACFETLVRLAAEGRTVLVVSHQLNLVARFADHVVLLAGGEVVAAGGVGDVMRGEVLERVYEWPLVVTRDPAVGAPALVPLRRPQ
ncbi:MAG: ABC transporter ATP-binding protein [Gemmatimonadetes bacterium]|nr:ABC transporter ATP-binding protein [Gemmatimonadota bacterium]